MQDKKAILDKITKEHNDLDKKMIKLNKFLWSKDFNSLSPVLKELLSEQYNEMRDYHISLVDRIDYLNGVLGTTRVEYYENKHKENEKGSDFGKALQALKLGLAVTRSGWNGKGIYIELKKGERLDTPNNRFDKVMTHDFIYINTTGLKTDNPDAPKGRVPWTPSQTDLLAHDWRIYLD